MFTQTFKASAICLMLAGCQATDILQTALPGATPDPGTFDMKANLPNGITITGPKGYCIDSVSSPESRGAFKNGVTVASCALLSQSDTFDPTEARILTATHIDGPLPAPDAIKAFLQTSDGLSSLAADGQASSVIVHQVITTKAAVYIDLTDSSRPAHLGQRSWRAVLRVKDTGLILGVYAGSGDPVDGKAGEATIRDFAAEILRANE